NKITIPYTLSAKLDYTRGTVVAQRIDVKSGKSAITLQGRINDVLAKSIAGRLEYKGTGAVPFLNHFFPKESFGGSSDLAGVLEFSDGYFFTNGIAKAENIAFEGWSASKFHGEYSYHYPGRRLTLRQMGANALDGSIAGNIVVEPLPGDTRVSLDLD